MTDIKQTSNKKPASSRNWRGYLFNTSYLVWVMSGFAVSYMAFFIGPVFLNHAHMMQIYEYLPRINPVGVDLSQMLSYSNSWFVSGNTPYIGYNLYPPLASILFAPLLAVNFTKAFILVTIITIASYSLSVFIIPLFSGRERKTSPLLILVFVTGLFSYGFQFELERGQFNVIAMFLCLLSIWIYHYQHKYRFLAYVLFSLSIQLKVYPVIFIVMFIQDWRDWKNNIRRVLGLTVANVALLFVMGPGVFVDFLKAIQAQSANPPIWDGNHSIRSFVGGITDKLRADNLVTNDYSSLMQITLLVMILACVFVIILKAFREKSNGMNTNLLLACTIAALLIPSVSHDYKLSILAAPMALFYHQRSFAESDSFRLRMVLSLLAFVMCTAYSSTLFSFTNKPTLLGNNLTALMVMLFAVTAFSLLDKSGEKVVG